MRKKLPFPQLVSWSRISEPSTVRKEALLLSVESWLSHDSLNGIQSIQNRTGPYQRTPFRKLQSSYEILRFFPGPWTVHPVGDFLDVHHKKQKHIWLNFARFISLGSLNGIQQTLILWRVFADICFKLTPSQGPVTPRSTPRGDPGDGINVVFLMVF